jgi:hypothetical protein
VGRLPLGLACFAFVTGVYLLHLFLAGYDRFYYDAEVYWRQGQSFGSSGHFSLLDYSDSGGYPRGYSLPLLNYVLHGVGRHLGMGDVTVVKVFGALLAATLGTVLLPRLARALLPSASIGWGRILALNALVFLFWRDHFDFPLSDFPALSLAVAGLLALLSTTEAGYLAAGLAIGLAANMRPAYLIALLLAILLAGFVYTRARDLRGRAIAMALVVLGAFVSSLPQILINNHRHDGPTPFVPGQRDISLLQLSDGMKAQKYETYVGRTAGYPQPQVFYLDPSTQHVLDEEHVSYGKVLFGQKAPITSYGQYARIALDHPAEMAAGWARRIFNGLDVRYPTPYIRSLGDTSLGLSLLDYTLLFVAVATLVLRGARRALGGIRWWGVVILLSPCVTAATGAVEPRFFLPATALVYALVCFGPATGRALVAGGPRRRIGVVATYVGFVVLCLTLSSATLAQLEHPGQTLGLGASQPWPADGS